MFNLREIGKTMLMRKPEIETMQPYSPKKSPETTMLLFLGFWRDAEENVLIVHYFCGLLFIL